MASNEQASSGEREHFGSRLGFILISAGCAIGLGNVWRFPYIVGQYGGAAFVLLITFFLIVFVLPILVMEFAVGRASQKSIARAYDVLEPKGRKWHRFKWVGLAGNYILLMFYVVITGWMLAFMVFSLQGAFNGIDTGGANEIYQALLANPVESAAYAIITVLIGVLVSAGGVQKGVERITKGMMAALFVAMILLCIRSLTLPGAAEGINFYLMPDFSKIFASSTDFTNAVLAAMGQAFFMVSVGQGGMMIFGSYIGKERKLTGEAINVTLLDLLVAIMAGLIVFPACSAFGVSPDSGPGLVFITLPAVFTQMPGGQFWGALFFLFLSFAALSTVIAVFENIVAFSMDEWGTPRRKACLINGLILAVLCLPCVLGFNIWSGFQVPGIGNIQSLEDFLVSNTILPLGSLFLLLFCVTKRGWGWKAFLAEADAGKGINFPKWTRVYMTYVLPILIAIVLISGYAPIVANWIGLG